MGDEKNTELIDLGAGHLTNRLPNLEETIAGVRRAAEDIRLRSTIDTDLFTALCLDRAEEALSRADVQAVLKKQKAKAK